MTLVVFSSGFHAAREFSDEPSVRSWPEEILGMCRSGKVLAG